MTKSQFLEGGCWEREGWPLPGGCSYIKNKLKSEIFNDKKSLQTEIFLSVVRKNLNREYQSGILFLLSNIFQDRFW